MNDIAIRVENLSKVYRIGVKQERYKTLRDTLVSTFKNSIKSVFPNTPDKRDKPDKPDRPEKPDKPDRPEERSQKMTSEDVTPKVENNG